MLVSAKPASFPIPFAANAGGSFIRPIPVASQIGIQAGAASLTDGFVPENFTQVAAGGVPPFGQDMNGILNQSTSWNQWFEAGAPIFYDATLSTGIGGYPKGALVQSNVTPGNYWMSTVDNNTTDPDSISAANWVPDPGRLQSGQIVPWFSSTLPAGFVPCNSNTIGKLGSNATSRENNDTLLAYRVIWRLYSNSQCPIFTLNQVPTTRGANPDADFAAFKALSTPDLRGEGIIGCDTMGGSATARLTGVPVSVGSSTTTPSVLGENLHSLSGGENGVHSHANTLFDPGHTNINTLTDLGHVHDLAAGATAPGNNFVSLVTNTITTTLAGGPNGVRQSNSNIAINNVSATTGVSITNVNSGSAAAHNTVGLNTTAFWAMKL